MKQKTLNGILCIHDTPVDFCEANEGVLYLHNERLPLGCIIKDFANYGPVSINYFVSAKRRDEDQHVRSLVEKIYGKADVEIDSSGHPYSEVTPDICWSHTNEFRIGGHDMNAELKPHVGKWLLIRLTREAP